MKNLSQQPLLFAYRTNALSSTTHRHRGHYRRIAVTMLLIGSFGYLTLS